MRSMGLSALVQVNRHASNNRFERSWSRLRRAKEWVDDLDKPASVGGSAPLNLIVRRKVKCDRSASKIMLTPIVASVVTPARAAVLLEALVR